MEKKPKQKDFAAVNTSVHFDTISDSILCVKEHLNEDGTIIHVDKLAISLKVVPFQTAMSMACEYVRSVVLVDYEN